MGAARRAPGLKGYATRIVARMGYMNGNCGVRAGARMHKAQPYATATRTSCYTEFVLKNVTITVDEDALRWAKKHAAEKNTSGSKLVGRMLEDKMRQTDEYWAAYERMKNIKPI